MAWLSMHSLQACQRVSSSLLRCGPHVQSILFVECRRIIGLFLSPQGDGSVGSALVSADGVDMVAMTGSSAVGRKVSGAAAGAPMVRGSHHFLGRIGDVGHGSMRTSA